MKDENNKTMLCIISCILMIIGIGVCFAVAVYGSEEEKLEKTKVEEKVSTEDKQHTGSLEYTIGTDNSGIDLKDIVDLKDDVIDIYEEYEKYSFKELDLENDFIESYTITIDDIVIMLEPNSSNAKINGRYYDIGGFYDYLTDYIHNKIKDKSVYLYNYEIVDNTKPLYSIDVTDKDEKRLEELLSDINYVYSGVETTIEGKHLVVIDDIFIYFDAFDGLAMINNEIVVLPTEMLDILDDYFALKTEECCSCCPDLKPGESCIALCCPCGE